MISSCPTWRLSCVSFFVVPAGFDFISARLPEIVGSPVLRLVQADFSTTRQLDSRPGAPVLLCDGRAFDLLLLQSFDLAFQIVAYQIERRSQHAIFVMERPVVHRAGMDRRLAGRKLEDQPTVSGIYKRPLQHIAKELTIRFCIVAEKKNV